MAKQRTTPTSISIPADLLKKAKSHAKKWGYESFSRYVESLILIDLEETPTHFVVREEGSVRYGRKKKEDNPFEPPEK